MLLNRHRTLVVDLVRLGAVATALLMLTVLIVSRSQAAFTDTTDNTTNSFATGSVVITDDDTANAMFTASGMTPGTPAVNCITLTYSGTLVPADIRMYGTAGGTLATYLNTTVEVGSGGSFGNCTGFTPASTIYSGTLANFGATHIDWASGIATFTAPTNPTSRTVRITVDVQNNPSAQGQSASAAFTWEAQD
jgi:hypothetical protein